MEDVEKYRQYAAECRRLSQKSSQQDRAVLLEIAKAWVACAERAEASATRAGKGASGRKTDGDKE